MGGRLEPPGCRLWAVSGMPLSDGGRDSQIIS